MIVEDVVLFQQRDKFVTCVPGWRCVAFGWRSGEGGQDVDGSFEDGSLLGEREFGDVFVCVAVETASLH